MTCACPRGPSVCALIVPAALIHERDVAGRAGNAGAKELFELDSIERLSMACPALPLCGLAIGEVKYI